MLNFRQELSSFQAAVSRYTAERTQQQEALERLAEMRRKKASDKNNHRRRDKLASEAQILAYLNRTGESTTAKICRANTSLSRSCIQKQINDLAEQELIDINEGEVRAAGRACHYHITEAGRQWLANYHQEQA